MAGLNLLGPKKNAAATAFTPLVYTSPAWNGTWTLQDHAIFDSVKVFSGSEGVDALEFETPYGTVLTAGSASFAEKDPLALLGSWAKLVMVDEAGAAQTVFVGQILDEDRQVFGSDSDVSVGGAARPKGFQRWSALGGAQLLEKISVSASYFAAPLTVQIGWAPGFNARDPQGLLRGNRSDSAASDDPSTFVFGGTSTWTRRQALDYLLKRFLPASGPPFKLAGQLDVLDEDLRLLEVGITAKLLDLVRRIVAHREGIEFGVRATVADDGSFTGFEIRVFTLVASPITFKGCTIPANPNAITFSTSDMQSVASLHVVKDRSHTFSRIRVVGDRVVVCGTLRGPKLSGAPTEDVLTSPSSSLIGKWTTALETAYKVGDPNSAVDDFEDLHDAARADERFRAVYTRYGLPVGYTRPPAWLPKFDGSGNLGPGASTYQDSVRETLSWIPLLEGYDYTQNPAVNGNPTSEATPDFRAPFVVVENRKAEQELLTDSGGFLTATIWSIGDQVGLGHSALKKDLGLLVHATPNHRLALGRAKFDGTDASVSRFDPGDAGDAENPSDEGQGVDARTLAATIAWRSDVRFVLEYALDAASDDGSVMEVAAPEAQLWWLAPSTIVGVVNFQPVDSGSAGIVLRNDADLFAPMMAGLIARYTIARSRVDLQFHGWRPWLGLLGAVLTTVEEGGETHGVNAPITYVELRGGRDAQPSTVVKAGFAQ